jgi:hypothetical protein
MRLNKKHILIAVILIAIFIYIIPNNCNLPEGYENLFALKPGDIEDGDYLLKDMYPISTHSVSNQQYSNKWNVYPVFSIPSFNQMTNNLRYFSNPSITRESPEDFLDTYYGSKTAISNIVSYGEVKPIVTHNEPRVGYWNSIVDVLY